MFRCLAAHTGLFSDGKRCISVIAYRAYYIYSYCRKLSNCGMWTLCRYLCVLSVFHYSEYLCIAITNPKTLTIDAFMLNHSLAYGAAAVASWVEFAVEHYYFSCKKSISSLNVITKTSFFRSHSTILVKTIRLL